MMPNLTTAVAVVAVFSAFFLAHEPPKDAMTPLPQQQQRVLQELAELDERRAKLMAFFSTPIFHGLPESEQIRLERQAAVMRSYSGILAERIAAF